MKNRIVDLKPAGAPAIKYLAFSGLPDFASVARDAGDRWRASVLGWRDV
jgi:hypothetical protein